MLQRIADKRREDQGFTLIELLVVIVILGILAAVVVFAVGGITDKGQTSANDADFKTMQTAQEAYFANVKPPATPSYATEGELLSAGFLASQSSKHDICLIKAASGITAKSKYEVVVQGATPGANCSAGYSPNGA